MEKSIDYNGNLFTTSSIQMVRKIYLLTNISLNRYTDDILICIIIIEIVIVKIINKYIQFIIKALLYN